VLDGRRVAGLRRNGLPAGTRASSVAPRGRASWRRRFWVQASSWASSETGGIREAVPRWKAADVFQSGVAQVHRRRMLGRVGPFRIGEACDRPRPLRTSSAAIREHARRGGIPACRDEAAHGRSARRRRPPPRRRSDRSRPRRASSHRAKERARRACCRRLQGREPMLIRSSGLQRSVLGDGEDADQIEPPLATKRRAW